MQHCTDEEYLSDEQIHWNYSHHGRIRRTEKIFITRRTKIRVYIGRCIVHQ